MKTLYHLIIGLIIGLILIVMLGIPQDAYRRTVNKCDQYCLAYRQYPKIEVRFGIPVFACGCGGFRMPDNYLRQK